MPAGLNMKTGRRRGGYALLEYLAALALSAVGMLGLLQAQALSTELEQTALNRLRAGLLLTDLTRKFDAVRTSPHDFGIGLEVPPPAAKDCRAALCTGAELAAFHLAHWKCRLGRWSQTSDCRGRFAQSGQLAEGDGSIAADGGGLNIVLRWQPPGRAAQILTHHYAPPAE